MSTRLLSVCPCTHPSWPMYASSSTPLSVSSLSVTSIDRGAWAKREAPGLCLFSRSTRFVFLKVSTSPPERSSNSALHRPRVTAFPIPTDMSSTRRTQKHLTQPANSSSSSTRPNANASLIALESQSDGFVVRINDGSGILIGWSDLELFLSSPQTASVKACPDGLSLADLSNAHRSLDHCCRSFSTTPSESSRRASDSSAAAGRCSHAEIRPTAGDTHQGCETLRTSSAATNSQLRRPSVRGGA